MRKYIFPAVLCAALLLCACEDLSEYEPPHVELAQSTSTAAMQQTAEPVQPPEAEETAASETTALTTTTSTSATTSATTTAATTTTTAAATTTTVAATATAAEPVEEQPSEPQCSCSITFGEHYLSDAEKSFISQSLFVGDSICSGFEVYGLIAPDNVIATKSVGARNLQDYLHIYEGKEQEFSYILEKAQPKLVFLSMGMNDINMIGPDKYCDNYGKIIDMVLEKTDAEVYYCAITPVDSNFTSNERIQYFNNSMYDYIKEHYPDRVHTVDFGRLLVCDDGIKLCDVLSGGDGIHLAPYAYHMALWEIRRVLIEDGFISAETGELILSRTVAADTAEAAETAETAETAE